MSDKVNKLLDSISGLSVLELAELVKAIEEKFGVTQPLSGLVGPAGPALPDDAPSEQTTFNLVLTSPGANKIAVIKALREINPHLGLKDAKDLSEKADAEILVGVNKAIAEEAKSKLTAAGATVELK